MALTQITYNDKSNYQSSSLANEYKVSASDMNEIKSVVNGACTKVDSIDDRVKTALVKGFSAVTSVSATSSNGYGIVVVFSSAFVCVVQLQNTSATIIDVMGTHGTMTATMSSKVLTLANLYNWDHYIIMGSNLITAIQ